MTLTKSSKIQDFVSLLTATCCRQMAFYMTSLKPIAIHVDIRYDEHKIIDIYKYRPACLTETNQRVKGYIGRVSNIAALPVGARLCLCTKMYNKSNFFTNNSKMRSNWQIVQVQCCNVCLILYTSSRSIFNPR